MLTIYRLYIRSNTIKLIGVGNLNCILISQGRTASDKKLENDTDDPIETLNRSGYV